MLDASGCQVRSNILPVCMTCANTCLPRTVRYNWPQHIRLKKNPHEMEKKHWDPEKSERGFQLLPNATFSARVDSVLRYLSTRLLLDPATDRARVQLGSMISSNQVEFHWMGRRCWRSLITKWWNDLPASWVRRLTKSPRRAWWGCERWLLMGYPDFYHVVGSYVLAIEPWVLHLGSWSSLV